MRLFKSIIFALSVAFAIWLTAANAQGTAQKVDFKHDIEPILAGSCYQCHNARRAQGQLRLDAKKPAFDGGISGVAIVPGKSRESLLVKRLLGAEGLPRMPMGRAPLTDAQIALIITWIDEGAVWPDTSENSSTENVKKHWAYVSPVRPALPKVSNSSWVRNPIDAFVLARLDKEGLATSQEAAPEKLLRRAYLDIIGLPPTPTEIKAYLADARPDRYERLVDRLLESGHYGERMTRGWLDLARYADSNGYEKDNLRVMWKYRDWLINAFNKNMPFDQFVVEQIAGDMLPNATEDQRIATGFHRNTMLNQEGGIDPEEARFETMVDRVNTTATVFLGSTIGCAQCHNHKYDPFTQKDYYRLYAFFEGAEYKIGYQGESNDENSRFIKEPEILIATPDQEKQRATLESQIDAMNDSIKTKTPQLESARQAWESRQREAHKVWRVLDPVNLKSDGGTILTREADSSVMATGPNPEIETYIVTTRLDPGTTTALRIEALPDSRLPQGGPGRDLYGNFLLTAIDVEAGPLSQPDRFERIAIADIKVDDSAYTFEAKRFLDAKKTNSAVDAPRGWYINATRDPNQRLTRQGVVRLAKPLNIGAPGQLRLKLTFAGGSLGQGIGRFRLSATSDEDPFFIVSVPARLRPVIEMPVDARKPKDAEDVWAQFRNSTPLLKTQRDKLAALKKQLANLGLPTAQVMRERDSSEPLSTFVRERGGFLNKGERVTAGVPSSLPPMTAAQPANRLGLAYWLVDTRDPLLARVTMNRLWEQVFGRGIVETSEDFGSQSSPPSHPELLDWLATEFMAQKWNVKLMMKTILTSATYRQSSKVAQEIYERDPYNRLLARGPRFRMEAEMIRDLSLSAAGVLSEKIGGKSVFPLQPEGIWRNPYSGAKWETSPGEDRYRRSIYTFIRRTSPYPSFMTFDGTSREQCTVRRVRTNTPLQALAELNDEASFELARAVAGRMIKEGGPDIRSRVNYGWMLCASRAPSADESSRLVNFYSAQRARFAKDVEAARNIAGSTGADRSSLAERAAWTMTANVLLNLDETLTKE